MKICYIMRGVPGSGKTTIAQKLSESWNNQIFSTDNYFMEPDENGDLHYKFDPSKLSEYHNKNFEDFHKAISRGESPVVVDNTNSRKWEYQRYVEAAEACRYTVVIVSMKHPDSKEAAKRNIHGVPESVIQKMIDRWEN